MTGHEVVPASDVLTGKVTNQGRYCQTHAIPVRYYCMIEKKQVCPDCVSLKKCPLEHNRLTLAEAANLQTAVLNDMVTRCDGVENACMEALAETRKLKTCLVGEYMHAKGKLDKVKEETKNKLEEMWNKKESELSTEFSVRRDEFIKVKQRLLSQRELIQGVCDKAKQVAKQGSHHDITFNFASLSANLTDIINSKPEAVSQQYAHMKFTAGKWQDYLNLPSTRSSAAQQKASEHLEQPSQSKPWVCFHQFNTYNSDFVHTPMGIAAHPDGNIAVTSDPNGVKIFSRTGVVQYAFQNAPNYVFDIAVTPDGRYIIDGKTKLLCYNKYGKQMSTIATSLPSSYQGLSRASTVAVDSKGRIITGLHNNTISIHYSDGTLESSFATDSLPYYISATTSNTLVVSFWDKTLKLLNYSGTVITTIQPPPLGADWDPGRTCCSPHDEIFVVNDVANQIHKYTSEGRYLSLVTSEVLRPRGITFSCSGDELIVAEENDVVKFFHQE